MTRYCRVCKEELVVDKNWYKSSIDKHDYICNECKYKAAENNAKRHESEVHHCIKCNTLLIRKENWGSWNARFGKYVCKKCENERNSEYNHTQGTHLPMSQNVACSSFLGVHIAEGLLKRFFKNEVKEMPYGNTGYDFICGRGYKVDVKSSCIHQTKRKKTYYNWMFCIRKNKIADYFLCLAFDDRENLNVLHAWIIPREDVDDKVGISISPNRLYKWRKYEIDSSSIDKCCTTLKSRRE